MKMTKGMSYIMYLVVMGIALVMGAVTNVPLFPALSITINFHNIINFFDPAGLIFMLAVCLISLLGTRSL